MTDKSIDGKINKQGFAMYRGEKKADGSFTWTPVIGDHGTSGYGFGLGINYSMSCNMWVYNGYLYIGEYDDEEIALERILFNKTGEDASGSMGGVGFIASYAERRAWTLSDENINAEMRLYLDGGALHMIVPVGSFAGAESYDADLALDLSARDGREDGAGQLCQGSALGRRFDGQL